MRGEDVLDLGGVDVEPAGNDGLLESRVESDEAVRVLRGDVARA